MTSNYVAGDTVWACPECGTRWLEDGGGAQDMPAECGPCGSVMEVIGSLSGGTSLGGFTEEDRARVEGIPVWSDQENADQHGGSVLSPDDDDALTRALAYIEQLEARASELERALEPFARVLADVLPSSEERLTLENHGFDPDEGIPCDLGPDAPAVLDYRRAARVLQPAPTEAHDDE